RDHQLQGVGVVVEGDEEEEGPELHKYEDGGMRLVGSLAVRAAQAKNTHSNGRWPTKSSKFILDLLKTLRRPEGCEIEGTRDELLNESLLAAATKEKEACLFEDLAQSVVAFSSSMHHFHGILKTWSVWLLVVVSKQGKDEQK
ncbi:hypothetical protein Tco_1366850, partial [Tanacetum coccineum]